MESINRLREDREAGVAQALEDHRNTQQKLPPQRKELSLREKELGLSREGTLGVKERLQQKTALQLCRAESYPAHICPFVHVLPKGQTVVSFKCEQQKDMTTPYKKYCRRETNQLTPHRKSTQMLCC